MKRLEREYKVKRPSTLEGWFMMFGKKGQIFYSPKKDKDIQVFASYYKRKVSTERLVAVTTGKEIPVAKSITKVTLL